MWAEYRDLREWRYYISIIGKHDQLLEFDVKILNKCRTETILKVSTVY